MEGQIRKQRQETLYRQRERRQRFVEIVVIAIACIVGLGVFAVIIYAAMKARGLI
jgi:ABC-type lipoprotein release transport system permease subunit